MGTDRKRHVSLNVEGLERRDAPSSSPWLSQSLDSAARNKLPSGWVQWSSQGGWPYRVSGNASYSPSNSLVVYAGNRNLVARTWHTSYQQANVEVGAAILLNSAVPTEIIARGTNLNGSKPTYYAVCVKRGVTVEIVRVQGGKRTILAHMSSDSYLSQKWVRVTLRAQGSSLKVQVFRLDTNQYLNASGGWTFAPSWALRANDSSIRYGGHVGLGRPASSAGWVYADDFRLFPAQGDTQKPTAYVVSPSPWSTLSGPKRITATAYDNVGVAAVEFYMDGVLRKVDRVAPYTWDWETSTASNGLHSVYVVARDIAGNAGSNWYAFRTSNPTLPVPYIRPHYSHIRVAQLAYGNTPFGSVEDRLLRQSVDLVVAGSDRAVNHVASVSSSTPRMLYTNLSSLYGDLLGSWLDWADRHGVSREHAFYHVDRATAFSGTSPTSSPVNHFWKVYRGSGKLLDYTKRASAGNSSGLALGAWGEAVYLAYPERFREINLSLLSGARNGWRGVVEYARTVDSQGRVNGWAPLPLLWDSTGGMTRSGQIAFTPPSNWRAGKVGNSGKLFFVRIRTVAGGTAPVARTILGRDYVNARGGTTGVIPAFDYAADRDGDGYLNDQEYARRAYGKDARFRYESRAFYRNYGQMRYATNPSSDSFRRWTVEHFRWYLGSHPKVSGLFLDNSSGVNPVPGVALRESIARYASDYARLTNELGRAVKPRWVLVNTAGGGTTADVIAQHNSAYYEEWAIRALGHNWKQFEQLAWTVERRAALRSPAPYAILDSHPQNGKPTDPRTQMATLAYYYLIASPNTFLNLFGGYEPSSTWSRHWFKAVAYNIGSAQNKYSVFAQGKDPSNPYLTYKVYQRSYSRALVLYKPLSFGGQFHTGATWSTSVTTHNLGGTYRMLRADGTLSAPLTRISLRNGEGVVLIRV